MSQPKVSVIIPVYNTEKYLRECLDSVVNQTLKDIEIICVDAGSTDGSLEILREYEAKDDRVKVLSQNNQFAGVAHNHGMEAASGEYYAFMDADDYYTLDALEKLYDISVIHQLDFVKAAFYNIEPMKEPYDTKYSTNGWVHESAFSKVLSFPENIDSLINLGDVPWNGMYRSAFLKENDIWFNNIRVINDHSFFIDCLIHARRAMVVSWHIAFHRVNQKESLIGTKSKSYQCQLDNYYLVKRITQNLPFDQRRQILEREIDGVLHWYYKLRPSASSPYAEQMDNQLRSFLAEYDENDVGIYHLLTMHHSDIYYEFKKEHFPDGIDPRYPCTVSIIIPVYNVEPYIDECLDSICNQTFQDIEIICVDDKSTDNSLMILQNRANRDPRIKVIAQDNNTHQGGARNTGLDVARGKYVWFVDADDYIDTGSVDYLVKKMEDLGNVDVLSFNGDSFYIENEKKIITTIGKVNRQWPKSKRLFIPNDYRLIPAVIEGTCWSYFSRRSFIDRYRFRPHIFYEDACFTFSVLTAPGVFYEIDYTPYHRRIRKDSTTSQNLNLNPQCIKDRIIALQDISHVIRKRNLPVDHYGVKWFKNWARYCIKAYWDSGVMSKEHERIIEMLCSEWGLLESKKDLEYIKNMRNETIIISLTSYPPRIVSVNKTIEALLCQTIKADKIILWLAEEEFPNREKDLPSELVALQSNGLEIGWCENIRSYKKLIPTLKLYPDSIIITADDDIYYHPEWLERLYHAFVDNPDCIQCHRITKFSVSDDGSFSIVAGGKDYWPFPCYLNKLTGCGGVLYPPHCFHPDVLDESKFMSLAPTSDDLWFWLMATMAGYRVNVVQNPLYKLNYVEGTQECALCLINDHGEQLFWVHFNNIIIAYPQLKQRLQMAYREAISIEELNAARDELKRTREELAAARDELKRTREELNVARDELQRSRKNEDALRRNLDDVHNSASFRIGRAITWLPRKIRGAVRSFGKR